MDKEDRLYRLAVASTDGKQVDQHFGRCEGFYIYDYDREENLNLVEVRKLPAVCRGEGHGIEEMEARARELSDCNYVLVAKIGPVASNTLDRYGISAYELPEPIEDAIYKLLTYVEIRNMLL